MQRLIVPLCVLSSLFVLGCSEAPSTVRLDGVVTSIAVPVPEGVVESTRAPGADDGYVTFASGGSTVLYVNYNGAQIKYAYTSDASQNASYIGGGTVPAFSGSQAVRDQVTNLMRQLYAAYNIQVVTERPTSGDYDMVVVGGTPAHIGMNVPQGVAGVAPMDCKDQMPRDVAFVFSQSLKYLVPSQLFAQSVAETAAHESAHVYGLPHSNDACDLMSYGQCYELKRFLNKQMAMQSDSYGQCGMTSMNSHQLLMTALGPNTGAPPTTSPTPTEPPPSGPPSSSDVTPPTVAILTPGGGDTVGTTFDLTTKISDDSGQVVEVQVYFDGQLAGSRQAPPYDFKATNVELGQHTITVVAYDAAGNAGQDAIQFTVSTSPAPSTPPPSSPPPQQPADPAPTPGPSSPAPAPQDPTAPDTDQAPNDAAQPGVFGASCDGPADCGSNLCAHDSAIDGMYCTAQCDPELATSCPDGSKCMKTNTAISVCSAIVADSDEDGSSPLGTTQQADPPAAYGGCAVAGAPADGTTLGGLLLLLGLLIRRRRTTR